MMPNGYLEDAAGSLYYEVMGTGDPAVLIHGFSLDHRTWRKQVRGLRPDFRVVTYDCRGFGRSSCPTGPYSHHEDLRRLLAHLGIDSAHLVGVSMGGRIALNYALRWPGSVRSLALIGTDVGGHRHRIDWDVDVEMLGLAGARAAWLAHELFDTVRAHRAGWAAVRAMVRDYSGWHWSHADIRVPSDTGAVERLHEVRARTSVIVGELDLPDFHEIARVLQTRIRRARPVVVPGVGHLVNLEAPETCTELLWRHFMGVSRSTTRG
ncbi:alpha/beta hydrolase [Micromonospora sp. NPDC047793]|uniref:alpha/beta fold hydrolase n=1 Tax=Micromonospora sp. NPDC047793 TaxID=3154342 RepID=UPI0033F53A37